MPTHDPIAGLDGLYFAAKQLVDGLYTGRHASPLRGSGIEFHDYRPYTPGDDLRSIDWKRYGRTDRYCPGCVEGVIQAHAFIQSGMAKKVLVIGAETLSRVVDKHDRDSMIYSDGAGACIVEYSEEENKGIISHATQTHSKEEGYYLFFGNSYDKNEDPNVRYIKMFGRKIYEFAISTVPKAMQTALEKGGVSVDQVKKVFIHQANEKMDEAIIKRFFRLYKKPIPEGIMPMSIHKLGNSSVATVPTLFDLVLKGKISNQKVEKGDVVLLASVGAGMNINAIVYRL